MCQLASTFRLPYSLLRCGSKLVETPNDKAILPCGNTTTPMAEPILASLIHGITSLLTAGVAEQGRSFIATGRDVRWLRDELHSMQLFLHEIEAPSSDGSKAREAWIDQLRDIMLDSEDAVDVFDASQVRGCGILGSLGARREIGARIRRIRTQLRDISRRRLDYATPKPADSSDKWIHGLLASSPLIHDKDTVGLDRVLDELLQHILAGGSELSVISLVGMGGVGKTTLAKRCTIIQI
jgi:disease resistance protein RPM1